MLLIRRRAYARAGLVGNPSDGYHGKTISAALANFWAEVTLYEWDQIEIVWSQEDKSRFRSVHELVRDVHWHGYYGGVRLVKATIKRFVEHCCRHGYPLHDQTFSVRYQSNIPRACGLAGSSAIIVATLRALMDFYRVALPLEVQPSLALSVERDELGIAAGLQDRVVQVYRGLVYMDFARESMRTLEGLPCGIYEPLDPGLLPPLYLAYSAKAAEPTEVVHNDLRARYAAGETAVVEAMRRFAELTVEARRALLQGDSRCFGTLLNAGFDLRRSICRLPALQVEMIDRARAAGAAAAFPGSGGAIVGTFADETVYRRLVEALEQIDCVVVRPRLALAEPDA